MKCKLGLISFVLFFAAILNSHASTPQAEGTTCAEQCGCEKPSEGEGEGEAESPEEDD